jgi:hypothetical protein
MMEGPCADSEEKREPVGDIDTEVVESLETLDPKWPIREADIRGHKIGMPLGASRSSHLTRSQINMFSFSTGPCAAVF